MLSNSKKIHIGCGPHNLMNGWRNVDIKDFSGVDDVFDVSTVWPYEKGSIEYVYAEHFLEHLSFSQAIEFLIQAGQALKLGGVVRLTTPALEWVIKTHFSFSEKNMAKKVNQTWGINRAFHGWGHQFLYSKEMIKELLEGMGFTDVKFYDFGQSEIKHLKNLEQHPGWRITEWGFPTVWIVEATKGSNDLVVSQEFLEEAKETYIKYAESDH